MADFTGIPITHPPAIPITGAPHAQAPQASPQARHAAEEFESVFLTEMMQPMFEGIGTDGIGEGGDGEQMFRPMLIEQYAAAISKSGAIGITSNILHELTRLQSAAHPAATPEAGEAPPANAQAIELNAAAAQRPIPLEESTHGADR